MLLGSEIGAALTVAGAARHRPDRAQLRDRPGRDERAPALPVEDRPDRRSPACRTPACRSSPPRVRTTRSRPSSSPTPMTRSPASSASAWSAAAAVRRRNTCAWWSSGSRGRGLAKRKPRPEPGVSSLYQHVGFRQDTSYLSIGERTNANGSKAFRDAMLAEKWDDCVEIARAQIRDGAHLLDLCIDYVGRDGVADMRTAAAAARHLVHAADHARLDRARRRRGRASRRWPGAASSTRSTTRTATVQARGSPGSCRSCASTERPSSRSRSTRRARPAPPTTRSRSPAG